jgi:hypothetical protein
VMNKTQIYLCQVTFHCWVLFVHGHFKLLHFLVVNNILFKINGIHYIVMMCSVVTFNVVKV